MQTLPDAILAPDGLNMNPNGATGTHVVSKSMIVGCLPLSQSAEKPDMCLVGSQGMCLVESQDMCLVESQDMCLVEGQDIGLVETQDTGFVENRGTGSVENQVLFGDTKI